MENVVKRDSRSAMTTKTPSRPTATLTHLHRADGSATYAHGGYKVIGAVSGPVEVSRREEIPEEASVEVNVRPASGVGSKLTTLPPSLSSQAPGLAA